MKKLLLVEDDEMMARSLARLFRREGYAVRVAPDAESAIEALEDEGFHVIVSDLDLPGRSGLELLGFVDQAIPRQPFVFHTGRPEAVASCGRRVVPKGSDFAELAAAVDAALNAD